MSAEYIAFSQIEFAEATKEGLRDVAILTKGEARGHGMVVDDKTIEQFLQLSSGKTIPAYLTHAGAQDEDGEPMDRLGKEIGMFSGFFRDGDKVRAKSFRFLEAFKATEPKAHSTLVELAKEFSDKLGISPVVRHFKAWALSDGSEVKAEGNAVPSKASGSLPAMRLGDILSCDFVRKAALNTGLFHEIDGNPNNKPTLMANDTIALSEHTKALSAKDGEIATLSQQHKDAVAALETKHKDAVAALEAKVNDAVAKLAQASDKEKSLTAALAAKANEADEAAKYDMRKAGAPALDMALQTRIGGALPAPADNDKGRWEQYAALCEIVKDSGGSVIGHKETPAAKAFKDKHLVRK